MTVLSDAASRAPDAPGVYFMLDAASELLYVGKARELRRRLRQHAAARPSLERLAHLYERVAEVRWHELPDEAAAVAWETDLIAALLPPCNAGPPGVWNYLVVSPLPADRLRFSLSASPVGGRSYGCFPHLGKGVGTPPGLACSDGYTAFLRLLWAASEEGPHVPSKLTRSAPVLVALPVKPDLHRLLHNFLGGVNDRLLSNLPIGQRDPYLQPGLRRDRSLAHQFFAYGPAAVRKLRLRHGLRPGPLTRETFTELVRADAVAAVGEFRLSRL